MNDMDTLGQFFRRASVLQRQVLRLTQRRRGLALGLAVAAIAALPIPSAADRPAAARVANLGEAGDSGDFWIQPDGNTRPGRVARGAIMRDGGRLSVPTEEYWAAFAFVGGGDRYSNLLVKTHNRGTYTFPCRIRGNFIIGWSGAGSPGSGQRACSQGDDGILEIDRSSNRQTSLSLPQSSVGVKQAGTPAADANLSVEPGQSQTVIRVISRPLTTQVTEYRLVECSPEICSPEDGSHITLEDKVAVETERVTIEVLEGDVAVQAEGEPSATTVRKGQRYVYPNPALDAFDPGQAGSSCEMLRFLNPAYWVDDELPPALAAGIAAQLKAHRDALGVSGRPPNNLSALEQAVVAELNRVRTNPQGYADLIEANKQDFYNNWLQLRGYSLNPGERRRLVDEAIASLRQRSSLPKLDVSDGMSRGNRDHVVDQGRSGLKRGHTGDNLSGPGQRLSAYGSVRNCGIRDEASYENVTYVDSPTAQRVVMEMLIGDNIAQAGYEDAGDRDNLFNPDFQVIGVACGTHRYLRNMCVITYASGYLEGNSQ
ncbi:CAP domain-containing protein [Nodosilinea sp. PGN35]|uniref:CAP domain-containing protein n=1 Tax=Nodosilinea sp. PGN35 TaxID=3020489 RepID=UPI0023B21FFA|nr:CAP domain-containing protein [Nodosilinea sp. TSF1-S3]MDF0368822.1 hypothetical protein [Nodosilinea sp. TSF1-S3]